MEVFTILTVIHLMIVIAIIVMEHLYIRKLKGTAYAKDIHYELYLVSIIPLINMVFLYLIVKSYREIK